MFFLLSHLACSTDLDHRSLPQPTFEAEHLYNRNAFVTPSTSTTNDPFESLSRTVAQPETVTQQVQLINLGGIVRSTIPLDSMGNGWNVSSQGTDFLVVHLDSNSGESTPSVLIYGYYDSSAGMNKTLTSRRFISVIDPSVEQSGVWEMSPFIFSVLSSQSLTNPLEFSSLSDVTNSFQPSMGLGLGYKSNPDTFSGWRWVGQNDYGVYLRLGKTTGTFSPVQDELKMAMSEFTVEDLSLDADLFDRLSSFKDSLYSKSGKPAEMIFGSLSYNRQVVYIAVMCITQPTCKEEDALIDFFKFIQPVQSTDVFSTTLHSSPTDLASQYNIPLFQSSADSFSSSISDVKGEIQKLKSGESGLLSQLEGSVSSVLGDVEREQGSEISGGNVNEVGQEAPSPEEEDSGF